MTTRRRLLLISALLAACSPAPAPAPVDGAASPASAAGAALPPPSTPASGPAPVAVATSASPASDAARAADAGAGDEGKATAEPLGDQKVSATGMQGPSKAEPVPDVKVSNIGMHIGGGPNDAPTKAPIKRSVEPHFDAFRKCFAKLDEKKGGDFGIDLRIGRDGGKAKVSHPRTALKGKEFQACMVAAFEAIDFEKPKGGDTTVSYSVRFAP